MAKELEDLGVPVSSVAHDFNNALTAMRDYGRLLNESVGHDSESREDVTEIMTAADHATRLAG